MLDSNEYQSGISTFRVLASMDEGTWASDIAHGYSTDDIGPSTPEGLFGRVETDLVTILWDYPEDEDYDSTHVYKDNVLVGIVSGFSFEDDSDVDFHIIFPFFTEKHINESV